MSARAARRPMVEWGFSSLNVLYRVRLTENMECGSIGRTGLKFTSAIVRAAPCIVKRNALRIPRTGNHPPMSRI